jgi:hypothetical protein
LFKLIKYIDHWPISGSSYAASADDKETCFIGISAKEWIWTSGIVAIYTLIVAAMGMLGAALTFGLIALDVPPVKKKH